MRGNGRVILYSASNDSHEVSQKYIEAYNLLCQSRDQDDIDLVYYLNGHIERLMKLNRMGKPSAIELLGKLGLFMSEKNVICVGCKVKVDTDDGRKPDIYR